MAKQSAAAKAAWWQRFGNLSQVVSAVAAAGALAFVAYQVSLIEVNTRKSSARSVYQNYVNASLSHPEYLKPADYAAIKRDPVKFEQYKFYVAQMLFAYDEMIAAAGEKSWISSFTYELPDHAALICDLKASDPAFFTQFENDTVRLIYKVMAGKCPPRQ
ncbi:MAG: hypothetical protein JO237_14685 [Pseudolabrys sp.]|nr:hypothetical protein [Pseudolabrys sp.]